VLFPHLAASRVGTPAAPSPGPRRFGLCPSLCVRRPKRLAARACCGERSWARGRSAPPRGAGGALSHSDGAAAPRGWLMASDEGWPGPVARWRGATGSDGGPQPRERLGRSERDGAGRGGRCRGQRGEERKASEGSEPCGWRRAQWPAHGNGREQQSGCQAHITTLERRGSPSRRSSIGTSAKKVGAWHPGNSREQGHSREQGQVFIIHVWYPRLPAGAGAGVDW